MSAWESPIIRVTTGLLNTVNDTVIGGQSGISGVSKFAGQLGKTLWVDPSQIGQMYQSSVGTLYGGRYRYVRMRSADAQAVVGQIVFWDTTLTNWQTLYQVTTDEDLSSVDNAIMIAGIFLGTTAPGNYGFIQDLGIVPVQFRGTLTAAGAVGSRVYAAGVGAGVDEGFADVISSANPTEFSDVSLMQARYIGNAVAAPSNGSLTNVIAMFKNILG